jgi:membrane associated rhomboid family serine protease
MQYRPSAFKLLPDVVKNLLIINGLFFLATITFENRLGIDLTDILGLHYFTAEKFKPYQFITYMFMHGSFSHIFFNMFAVWMFGSAVENVWGSQRFLIYYLITGIGAALIQFLVFSFELSPVMDLINTAMSHPTESNLQAFFSKVHYDQLPGFMAQNAKNFVTSYNSMLAAGNTGEASRLAINFLAQFKIDYLNQPVVVGASGALFGLLLAFGMMFPNTLIYLYFAIPIKAKYFVMLYGGLELFLGISNNQGDNVAHFAHLGGMLFGFIIIKYWQRKHHRFH